MSEIEQPIKNNHIILISKEEVKKRHAKYNINNVNINLTNGLNLGKPSPRRITVDNEGRIKYNGK